MRLLDIVMLFRLRYPLRIVRENHALAGLSCVDAKDGPHRHPNVERHPAKARTKTDGVVIQLKVVCRRITNIQDDLAIFDVLDRHADTVERCIDDYVRRKAVITHPLVHRAHEIRSF